MKIKIIIIVFIFCFTTRIALGNGYSVVFSPPPERGISTFLKSKKFGIVHLYKDQIRFYNEDESFDDSNKNYWIDRQIYSNEISGKEISLFSRYGYVGNAKCYTKEPVHDDDIIITCKLREDCIKEIKKLPKYKNTFFMYPALNKLAPPPLNKRYTKKQEEMISSHTSKAIYSYIKKRQIKKIYPKYHQVVNNIEKIGARGPVAQFFIETKIGTTRKINEFDHNSHVFCFIIEMKGDVILQQLFGFLHGGGDGGGYIKLGAIGDINQDGLMDIFYIQDEIILFDGDKWIFLWGAGGC